MLRGRNTESHETLLVSLSSFSETVNWRLSVLWFYPFVFLCFMRDCIGRGMRHIYHNPLHGGRENRQSRSWNLEWGRIVWDLSRSGVVMRRTTALPSTTKVSEAFGARTTNLFGDGNLYQPSTAGLTALTAWQNARWVSTLFITL